MPICSFAPSRSPPPCSMHRQIYTKPASPTLIPAGLDYVTAQWGIWRAGGIAVPLSLSATEKELEYAISDSQANCLLTTTELAPKVKSLVERSGLRLVIVNDVHDEIRVTLPEIDTGRRAMILYTSGTTSKPKGVVTTHACITAQIESLIEAWRWQADDRIPLFLPLHHIHGIINIMSCALWSGRGHRAVSEIRHAGNPRARCRRGPTRCSWRSPRSTSS